MMDVIGRKWVLEELENSEGNMEIPEGMVIDLKIGDSRLAGWTGCNRYFASYFDLGDGMLRIGVIGSTKAHCEGMMVAERTFYEAMEKVTRIIRDGEALILCSLGDEIRLRFRPA